MVVVPLSHRGQCVGVLKAFSSEPGHFSDGDAAVLGLLSRVVGTTMYWATRYGESDLFHRATHDDLTGLANRALFMDRLHAAIAAARRNEARLAVMLLDMDGLKQINDGHGHAAGDATLMEFASRLNQTVGERELVARWGDEFAVLLSHAGEVDDIYALEQRLRAAWPAFRGRGPAAAPVGQLGRGPVPATPTVPTSCWRWPMNGCSRPSGPARPWPKKDRPTATSSSEARRALSPGPIGAAAHTARCPAGC
jgi:GGDEF domain-containing protein